MLNSKNIIQIFILLLLVNSINISQDSVFIDENFSDWKNVIDIYSDNSNDQISGEIDFKELKVTNNNDYLFLLIDIGTKINLQNNNELTIYIDTDYNKQTGFEISEIGADLVFHFGNRVGSFFSLGNEYSIKQSDIGIITSPTVSSNIFEIAINSKTIINNNKIFPSGKINIIIKDNGNGKDQIPNIGEAIEYNFQAINPTIEKKYSVNKLSSRDIRLLSYNVLFDSFFNQNLRDEYSRILKAINPDIIAFQEIYSHNSNETFELVNSILPLENNKQWFHSKVEDIDPNNQYNTDLVILSKFKIKEAKKINGFTISGNPTDRANFAVLLDLRPQNNSDLLIINAHLPSSSADIRRQEEVDKIMQFIRESKNSSSDFLISNNTPIIICGDMNFVGLSDQRNTLITGDISNNFLFGYDFNPDWDNTAFKDLKPYTTNSPFTFTWYDESNSYSPGRLDYIIYSESVLKAINSFVLFTKTMHADSLTKYMLNKLDVISASDHLPVVADFQIKNLTNINIGSNNSFSYKLNQNYPNPFNASTIIEYSIPVEISKSNSFINLKIYDSLGNHIVTLVNEMQKAGNYSINWNGNHLSSGIYFYRLKVDNILISKKMLLLK